jgi:hypothetical protein
MGKNEIDFLLLSSLAEVEDLRGKIMRGIHMEGIRLSTAGQRAVVGVRQVGRRGT